MSYLTIISALGIVVVFGYCSRYWRLKSQNRQKPKNPKSNPLSRPEKKTQLRRIK